MRFKQVSSVDAEEAEPWRREGKRCSEVFLGKMEEWEETDAKGKLFRASSPGKYVLVKDYFTHSFPALFPSNCIWLNFEG